MYTYQQAKSIVDERNAAWDAFDIDKSPAEIFEQAAELGRTNSNHVMHDGMFAAEGTTGIYLYPPGLFACGGIPDEAFVEPELLDRAVWLVSSRLVDYSDW